MEPRGARCRKFCSRRGEWHLILDAEFESGAGDEVATEGYSFGIAGLDDGPGGLGLEASNCDAVAFEDLAQLFGGDGSLAFENFRQEARCFQWSRRTGRSGGCLVSSRN